jgi:glycerol-3-phosphate acyltransferase PlsY
MNYTWYLLIAAAYLLGSIPSAVWLSKYVYHKDVREYGSKNAGATNTFRVLGKVAGTIVLVADILKGVMAVWLHLFLKDELSREDVLIFQLALGFAATTGHIYSIFTNFKGGKGVATFTGVLYCIFPVAALCCTAIFLLLFISFHYISLSSMCSALAFPFFAIGYYQIQNLTVIVLLSMIPLVVIYTHRSNIQRLLRGEENKLYLFGKPKT